MDYVRKWRESCQSSCVSCLGLGLLRNHQYLYVSTFSDFCLSDIDCKVVPLQFDNLWKWTADCVDCVFCGQPHKPAVCVAIWWIFPKHRTKHFCHIFLLQTLGRLWTVWANAWKPVSTYELWTRDKNFIKISQMFSPIWQMANK